MHTHMKGCGYEAWLRLCAQCEPTTNTCAAGMLQELMSPDFKNDLLDMVGGRGVPVRERESGKRFPMEIRVYMVLNTPPTAIAAQLHVLVSLKITTSGCERCYAHT
eukprot:3083915-Amphidinium_carterae.2